MSHRTLKRIIAELRRQGYFFDWVRNDDQEYMVSRADIEVGEVKYECDTVIEFEKGGMFRPRQLIFSTFIYIALAGEKAAKFYSVIDVLNYHYPGKFVLEQLGNNQNIYYITIERHNGINYDFFFDNLEHHALVKAQIKPEFDKLKDDLGLTARTLRPPENQFAIKLHETFRRKWLDHKSDISFLPYDKQQQ